jgi:hypothetical protein
MRFSKRDFDEAPEPRSHLTGKLKIDPENVGRQVSR